MTRAEFVGTIVCPHVLVAEFTIQPATFQTKRLNKKDLWGPSSENCVGYFVIPVSKREGANAFGSMVTFGRAGNNDLVFEHDRVSKFHGYFRQIDGQWSVCDADSQNGMTVDDVDVAKGDKIGVPVKSGASVTLGGQVELVFYLPEGLHTRCQALLRS